MRSIMWITVTIFVLTYLALCLGHLPGFNVDRTGAVVIGALAMIVLEKISAQQAWDSINYETIGMLFGLMVLSSSFIVCGFYDWFSTKIATLPLSSPALLAIFIVSGGLLASVLTNDVVVVAMTPILVAITLSRGLNPTPFLLGFCFATNSVATFSIIGSPQNIIIAQQLHLSFLSLMGTTIIPAILSMLVIWFVLVILYKGKWQLAKKHNVAISEQKMSIPLNKPALFKTAIIGIIVMIGFIFSSIPNEIIALGAAGLLLLSRSTSSSELLKNVDGSLIVLIIGLFIVNAGFAETGLPQELMKTFRAHHVNMNQPMALFIISSFVSNIVGNNPTVMLLIPFLTPTPEMASLMGSALALGTGFSSNMFIFSSLAGIIVVEQAKRYKVNISFAEFTKAGLFVAIIGMLICILNLILFNFLMN